MDLGLKDKIAFVSGSGSGLGQAVAECMAEEGASVILCGRTIDKLEEVRKIIEAKYGAEVLTAAGDLSKKGDVEKVLETALKRFGRIDILVNNTGGPPAGKFEDLKSDMWDDAYRLLLASAVNMSAGVLPGMKKRGWGRIINITSIAVKQPVENLMLSNSLRAAVTGFAKTLSAEIAPYGITVNNMLPGYTKTERLTYLAQKKSEASGISVEEVFKVWEKDIPMQRLAEPHEFAAMAVFLASEQASYITGQSIAVDGGWIRGLY